MGRGQFALKPNEAKMLFTIYVIMILLLRLMGGAAYFTLIPLGLFAMLTSLLVGRRVALVMNTLFCIIGCFIFNGDVQFLMYSLLVGTLGALLIQKTEASADGLGGCGDGGGQLCGNAWGRAVF